MQLSRRFLGFASFVIVIAAGCGAGGGDPDLWRHGSVVLDAMGGASATTSDVATGAGGAVDSSTTGDFTGTTSTSDSAASTSAVSSTAASTSAASTSAASTSASSSSAASSTAASSSSSGGPTGATWTEVYAAMFASSSGNCSRNGGCHTNSKSGFKCGSSSSTCYTGLVNSGWVSPGANASSSQIVDPQQSFFCGSLGGNMPPSNDGSCPNATDVQMLKDWLSAGAQND